MLPQTMHLSAEPTDAELLAFVEAWIDLLAAGDYAAAHAHTTHDPYYGWSPRLLAAVIAVYGLPEPHPSGKTFHVTARALAHGGPPAPSVERESPPPGAFAEVRYPLPLNGSWSELSATFRAERLGAGSRVVLQEVHVF